MRTPAPYDDAKRGPRLHKVLADAGVAARRDCEKLIVDGRVKVNGVPITTLPAFVDPMHDRVEVDGVPIAKPRPTKRGDAGHVYIMLHKPRRVVSTTDDELGRRAVTDLVRIEAFGAATPRLFPVGRLDADSTGLILLTNDGGLAQKLTHPRFGVPKQYEVSIRGKLGDEDIERLQRGLYLGPSGPRKGQKPTPSRRGPRRATMSDVKLLRHEVDRTRGDRTKLLVTLTEGQNREIRRLMARLGFNVRRLKRVALGPLHLGKLEVGRWRELSPAEVRDLRAATRQ